MPVLPKHKAKTNPLFWPEQLRMHAADTPERYERALHDTASSELLTWNVFASLDTSTFPERLAYRMQAFGGSAVRPPVKLSLWTGRRREPLLQPSPGYVDAARKRAAGAGGQTGSVAEFEQPIVVPVRVETPEVLILIDSVVDRVPVGIGGRDRIVELVDAGLEHARRLSKTLAVAVVYTSGTPAAAELSARLNALRDPARLAEAMPYRRAVPPVLLREVTWQQLLAWWEADREYLRLDGQPVKPFLAACRERGLLRSSEGRGR